MFQPTRALILMLFFFFSKTAADQAISPVEFYKFYQKKKKKNPTPGEIPSINLSSAKVETFDFTLPQLCSAASMNTKNKIQ